jgi:predicted XRE-type DNA-binding protein
MAKKTTKRTIEVEVGSGNVFKDLGLKDADELLAKSQLAAQIMLILEARKLTQMAAAKLLGIAQPKVSLIYRGRLDEFSIERLMRLLNALHRDVRIVVENQEHRRRGRVIVEAA